MLFLLGVTGADVRFGFQWPACFSRHGAAAELQPRFPTAKQGNWGGGGMGSKRGGVAAACGPLSRELRSNLVQYLQKPWEKKRRHPFLCRAPFLAGRQAALALHTFKDIVRQRHYYTYLAIGCPISPGPVPSNWENQNILIDFLTFFVLVWNSNSITEKSDYVVVFVFLIRKKPWERGDLCEANSKRWCSEFLIRVTLSHRHKTKEYACIPSCCNGKAICSSSCPCRVSHYGHVLQLLPCKSQQHWPLQLELGLLGHCTEEVHKLQTSKRNGICELSPQPQCSANPWIIFAKAMPKLLGSPHMQNFWKAIWCLFGVWSVAVVIG